MSIKSMELDDVTLKRIKRQYEDSIALPEKKPAHTFIVCPIGTVGSGKTTVMKPLAKRLGLVCISGDEIRKILKKAGYGWDRVRELGTSLVQKYARDGYGIAIDADSLGRSQNLKEFSDKTGIPLFWIHINPPEAFIIEKLKNYVGPSIFESNEAVIKNYRESAKRHREHGLDFPFICTLDTSRENLAHSIEVCAQKIAEAMR
ncbi:MAG: AAA family ATPase [Candidatus Paceibacteria bacterium]